MRYLPAIDVWSPGISAALYSGQLRLQPGQWIKCGPTEKGRCSRFAYANRGLIRAYHYPNASAKFMAYVEGCREHATFMKAARAERAARAPRGWSEAGGPTNQVEA